jgi:undecaprenyl diphosphate synthase
MSKNQKSTQEIQKGLIPEHVAIIMDGNGRWAQTRGLDRSAGHEEGVEAIRRVTKSANELGVKVLTLYAFSTENWKRPLKEIQYLMGMPSHFFNRFVPELIEENVKVTVTGFEQRVPTPTKRAVKKAVEDTKDSTGMILNFAFNYGGRAEITEAVRAIATDVSEGKIKPADIDEDLIAANLLTAPLGDLQEVDFLIRTSGEQRLSNFLLWQNAYSEFYFTSEYWPDFDKRLFEHAIIEYQERNRRYGGL